MEQFWNFIWLFFRSFAFIAYLFALFAVISHIFGNHELKRLGSRPCRSSSSWFFVLPFLSSRYLIARGRSMAERQARSAQQSEAATTEYTAPWPRRPLPGNRQGQGTPRRRHPDPGRIRRRQGQGAEPGLTVPLRPDLHFRLDHRSVRPPVAGQAMFVGEDDGVHTVAQPEFHEDAAHVGFDR